MVLIYVNVQFSSSNSRLYKAYSPSKKNYVVPSHKKFDSLPRFGFNRLYIFLLEKNNSTLC